MIAGNDFDIDGVLSLRIVRGPGRRPGKNVRGDGRRRLRLVTLPPAPPRIRRREHFLEPARIFAVQTAPLEVTQGPLRSCSAPLKINVARIFRFSRTGTLA